MNQTKVGDRGWINYVIVTQITFTCTEATRRLPTPHGWDYSENQAHDSFSTASSRGSSSTRIRSRAGAERLVNLRSGVLLLDGTTVDKPGAKKAEPLTSHWSGRRHDSFTGITLTRLAGRTAPDLCAVTSGLTTS